MPQHMIAYHEIAKCSNHSMPQAKGAGRTSYGCVMATCTHAVPSPASASWGYVTFWVAGSIWA